MRASRPSFRAVRLVVPLLAVALVPLAITGTAHAANPNALDTTCAGSGTVADALGSSDFSQATLIQPDGKILSIGHSDTAGSDDMIVIRYLTSCARDTSFGFNGVATIDASGADNSDAALAATLQPDGKIVLAGRRSNGSNDDVAVVRLTSTGALDTTWDGDGIAVLERGGNDVANAVVRQTDGKIAIAGSTDAAGTADSLLARFNTNGSLDNTFNGSGSRVYAASFSAADTFTGIAVQADGKLVAAGYNFNGSDDDGRAVRVNLNGSPDLGFASGGTFTDNLADERFNAIAIRPDQRILLAGYTYNGSDDDFFLRQLTTAGATNGYNTADLGGSDRANAIALQQDDGVVLAGDSSTDGGSIVVFGTGLGTLYSSSDGIPCGADRMQGVAVGADGTIVATGSCDGASIFPDFLLARWDGSPVMRFATAGYGVRENVGTLGVVVTRKGTLNAVTMTYATSNGTALAGSDYTAAAGTLSFAAGVASQTIPIHITNDTVKEAYEYFTVTLSNAGPLPWSVTTVPPTTTIIGIDASDQRVDGLVKNNGGATLGSNVYNATGASQTVTQNAARGQKKVYYVTVQNDGNVANTFVAKGTASSTGYAVAYFASTTTSNISYAMTHSGYSTGSLAVGATKIIRVEITSLSTAPHGSTKSVAVTSNWPGGDAASTDVVKANLHTL